MGTWRLSSMGYSLTEIMVGIAVSGVVTLVIVAAIMTMNRIYTRSEVLHTIDNTVRMASAVLISKQKCDVAIRGATAADLVIFNPAIKPESDIQNLFAGTAAFLTDGQVLSSNVTMDRIFFREVQPGQGRGSIQVGGVNLTTYSGEIVFAFITPASLIGGNFRQRSIPLTVATNPIGQIVMCYEAASVQQLCTLLEGTFNKTTGRCTNYPFEALSNQICPGAAPPPCPPAPGGNSCSPFYYISGIDANFVPICSCQQLCKTVLGPMGGGGGGGWWY